jgi:hypothetical protein
VLLGFGARVDAASKLVRDDTDLVGMAQDTPAEPPIHPFRFRDALLVVGLLVAALLIGGGVGYWLHGPAEIVVGVQAAPEKCEDKPDGSQVCWIPVWERKPTGQ